MEKGKSRDQSLYEYLECLQLEYITCELRKKVYFKKKDKVFYQRTMDRKKEKIEDIAGRNFLPTIFSDEAVRDNMYSSIYNSHGYPNFVYNSEADKEEFLEKDKEHYYSEGAEVRVLMENEKVEIGVVEERFLDEELIHVRLRFEEKASPYPIDRVTRIL